ncbi:hypothetical protein ACFYE9_32780 [Rhizobium leguminosarum]|uniref:Glycosyltransferase family 1 protein n=2 Tax=Rhizobium leguminosarum TaxID=384 RepID=A0A154IDP5_RHILE|nr:hypothetical protein [Rhizobium leguminosarum]KZA98565.1 hypothetical protein A4A59_26460 [Rhizobium leguminosarum]
MPDPVQSSAISPRVLLIPDVPIEKGFGHYSYADVLHFHLRQLGAEVAIVSDTAKHSQFHFEGAERIPYDATESEFKARLLAFQPDVVVFDTFPFWMFDQKKYKTYIEAAYANSLFKPPLVTVIRDIWAWREHVVDQIEEDLHDFAAVLIRGDEKNSRYEDPRLISFISQSGVELLRCGYIVDPWLFSNECRELSSTKSQTVIVHQGGSLASPTTPLERVEQLHSFFIASIKSKECLRKRSSALANMTWRVLLHPEYDSEMRAEIVAIAAESEKVNIENMPDKPAYLRAMVQSQIVLARSGYNTTLELMTTRTPRVIMPFAQQDAEQLTRLRMLAETGKGFIAIPGELGVRGSGMTTAEHVGILSNHIASAMETAFDGRELLSASNERDFVGGMYAARIFLSLAERSRSS